EVTSRVKTAIDYITEQYPRKSILIVGHDGSLRIALCELLELKSTQYWRFNLDPCSLTRVNVYPGGAILIRLNDVSHLEAAL
ncbi:MAG: histidine phosphatase family protein, partial [Blastochloris sp.]|nr:histidine phosphatase family protein [Blastochloris sp.]